MARPRKISVLVFRDRLSVEELIGYAEVNSDEINKIIGDINGNKRSRSKRK